MTHFSTADFSQRICGEAPPKCFTTPSYLKLSLWNGRGESLLVLIQLLLVAVTKLK